MNPPPPFHSTRQGQAGGSVRNRTDGPVPEGGAHISKLVDSPATKGYGGWLVLLPNGFWLAESGGSAPLRRAWVFDNHVYALSVCNSSRGVAVYSLGLAREEAERTRG